MYIADFGSRTYRKLGRISKVNNRWTFISPDRLVAYGRGATLYDLKEGWFATLFGSGEIEGLAVIP